MRTTIHLVSRREFWPYAMGVRQARRAWSLRASRGRRRGGDGRASASGCARRWPTGHGPSRSSASSGPGSSATSGCGWTSCACRRRAPGSGAGRTGSRWPSSGSARATRRRRRGSRTSCAPTCGRSGRPPGATSRPGRASRSSEAKAAPARGSTSSRYRDEAGRPLVDLAGAPCPTPTRRRPVRFLPHWDANLLVHARRTGILPEPFRPRVFRTKNPFSVGT